MSNTEAKSFSSDRSVSSEAVPYNEPAFPIGSLADHQFCGASLRDYFMAHAPAEPQPWFEPVMPTERPAAPKRPAELTGAERKELEGWREYLGTEDLEQPRARAYAEAYEANRKSAAKWDAERAKQFYIQWPAAWADAMLRARSAS